MDHAAYRELAAGAVLDDLDPAERAGLDDHLGTCGGCRDEARALADVAGLMALAVPARQPPASLQGSVLAAVAASGRRRAGIPAATLAYAGGTPIASPAGRLGSGPVSTSIRAAAHADEPVDLATLRRERTRYRRLALAGLAVAATLVVAVGALGLTAAGLNDRLERTVAERDAAVSRLATTDGAMSVVLAPDHATATLASEPMAGQATIYVVYIPGTTEAWLMADRLPATPAGMVYQLWSADAAGVHGLATFTCDGVHACVAPFGVDLAMASAAMVTLEPIGGARGSPGPQVAVGELAG